MNTLKNELHFIDELRNQTKIMAEACKKRMVRSFNSKMKSREFLKGDLVWRVQSDARKDSKEDKFIAN